MRIGNAASTDGNPAFFIITAFVVAITLSVMILPVWLIFRIEWVLLLIIYCSFRFPNHFDLGIVWLAGLSLDVIEGALLGQHSLTFVLIAYFLLLRTRAQHVMPFHQMRFWQHSIIVFIFIFLNELVYHGINVLKNQPFDMWFFLPAFTSALAAPIIFYVLNLITKKYI